METHLNVEPDLPLTLLDERALELALINLLDNALKYAKEGKRVEVYVVNMGGRYLEVRVRDHGPGIPLDEQRRIFDRFVRGQGARDGRVRGERDRSRARQTHSPGAWGTGVGEQHGGRRGHLRALRARTAWSDRAIRGSIRFEIAGRLRHGYVANASGARTPETDPTSGSERLSSARALDSRKPTDLPMSTQTSFILLVGGVALAACASASSQRLEPVPTAAVETAPPEHVAPALRPGPNPASTLVEPSSTATAQNKPYCSAETQLLPESYRVYTGRGAVVNHPGRGMSGVALPTANPFTGGPGCYVACYTHDQSLGVYSVGGGIYVAGQYRTQGRYESRVCKPEGFERADISASDEFKRQCTAYVQGCNGKCWAGGDTGGWFGLQEGEDCH